MSSVNTESLGMLTAMGFDEEEARVALLRTNNDISHAVELLSNGLNEEGLLIHVKFTQQHAYTSLHF